MPSVKSVLAASAIAFFTSVSGHMILLTPPPYGSPNSSPLDPSGSDFPCKGATGGGPSTNMPIGSKQSLSFKGSAVHGGGSCQVAVTTDNPATKNSKWMVIHSIEGGCPARGKGGNMGNDPNMLGTDKYDYTIPQGLTPGKYTLAWTWFNKIGNREMYMNCANIQISGGAKKRDAALNGTDEYSIPELSSRATPNFPDLFRANIPATDCTTTESTDLAFPDPGKSVEKAGTGQTAPPKGPKCGKAGAPAPASGGGATSGAGGAGGSGAPPAPAAGGAGGAGGGAGSGAAATPSAAPSAPASGGASSGGMSTGEASPAENSVADVPAPAAPSGASSGGGSAAPSGATANSGSGSGSGSPPAAPAPAPAAAAGGASKGTCSQSGQSICSPDGKQIGTCTAQMTVTWIPVAAGTKCAGGQMVHANARGKRSARFSNDYMFGQ